MPEGQKIKALLDSLNISLNIAQEKKKDEH